MNSYWDLWGWRYSGGSERYIHSWPGQVQSRYTGRHRKRRQQRAIAKRRKG